MALGNQILLRVGKTCFGSKRKKQPTSRMTRIEFSNLPNHPPIFRRNTYNTPVNGSHNGHLSGEIRNLYRGNCETQSYLLEATKSFHRQRSINTNCGTATLPPYIIKTASQRNLKSKSIAEFSLYKYLLDKYPQILILNPFLLQKSAPSFVRSFGVQSYCNINSR